MGTNYYLHSDDNTFDKVHIGLSSHGWCFGLHVYPERGINDLCDWQQRWKTVNVKIKDEYGQDISSSEMLKIITIPNSFGVSRHAGSNCIGRGSGVWDLIVGGFG